MTAEFGMAGRSELVLVSAADDASLVDEIARLVAFLDRIPDAPLADIAYTCSLSRGDAVLALVVSSVHELRAQSVNLGRFQNRVHYTYGTHGNTGILRIYFRDYRLYDLGAYFPEGEFWPDWSGGGT